MQRCLLARVREALHNDAEKEVKYHQFCIAKSQGGLFHDPWLALLPGSRCIARLTRSGHGSD